MIWAKKNGYVFRFSAGGGGGWGQIEIIVYFLRLPIVNKVFD